MPLRDLQIVFRHFLFFYLVAELIPIGDYSGEKSGGKGINYRVRTEYSLQSKNKRVEAIYCLSLQRPV